MAATESQLEDDQNTYKGFLTLMKIGTTVAIAMAALVVLIIAT